MFSALVIQNSFDLPTKYQLNLLTKQVPFLKALSSRQLTLLVGNDVNRRRVINELKKDYAFVYIGSHGNPKYVKDYRGRPLLTRQDADLFVGKRVYAYVCSSFESHIFDKALESITYKGKFYFPKGSITPKDPMFEILQLGFYPLNRALEQLSYGFVSLYSIFNELSKQYELAMKRVKDDFSRHMLLINGRAVRYIGPTGVLSIVFNKAQGSKYHKYLL